MTPGEIGIAAAQIEAQERATMTIEIEGYEHKTMHEATQVLDAEGYDHAILFAGKYLSVTQVAVDMLFAKGLEFAYLVHHEPSNKVMSVPAY